MTKIDIQSTAISKKFSLFLKSEKRKRGESSLAMILIIAAVIFNIFSLRVKASSRQQEIVFIDAGVKDAQVLVDGIRSGIEIVLLDADRDGVKQISSILEGKSGINVIHVISHGESGKVFLGNSELSMKSLGKYEEQLKKIGKSLKKGGDILFYGCDVGTGPNSAEIISSLAETTKADIAASSDLTGAAVKGGNWDLEIRQGVIEASSIVVSDYDYVLVAPVDQNFDAVPIQESAIRNNPSLTLGGVVYSTDSINDALRVDTVDQVTGYLPTLGTGNALASTWYGTNTGTYFQFASANNANNFKLLSLRAEVWGGSCGTAEKYTISGYDNGIQKISATVTFTASGTYGLGNSTIIYNRQTTSAEEVNSGYTANAGLLTFGSDWNNIDQVRFTVADSKILGVSIDQIDFSEPIVAPTIVTNPNNATVTAGSSTSFTVAAAGTGLTYRWQVDNGSGFTNINDGVVYGGATTATLSITGTTAGMNGYSYRVVVTGNVAPIATSNSATLTVNAVPAVISISVSPASASVVQGGEQQLTAMVEIEGGASQTVNWTSNDGAGKVTVNESGLINVAADAIPGDYIITATSTVDESKKGTATITIPNAPVSLTITAGKGLGRIVSSHPEYANVKIPFVIDSQSFAKNITSYSFDVVYDPTKVGTVTVDSFNGLAKPSIGTPTAVDSKEKVTVSWSGTFTGDLTTLYNNSEGVLFKLNFVVKPAFNSGETAVEVDTGSFTFTSGENSTNIMGNNGKIMFGIYGDVNGDGVITTTDTGLVNKYTAGKTSAIVGDAKLIAADVNEDGSITVADAKEISNYISGKSSILKSLFGY